MAKTASVYARLTAGNRKHRKDLQRRLQTDNELWISSDAPQCDQPEQQIRARPGAASNLGFPASASSLDIRTLGGSP